MLAKRKSRLMLAGASVLAMQLWLPVVAHADDYSDLLDLLRAKGTISQSDYSSLMAKHRRSHRHMGRQSESATEETSSDEAAQQAQQAAAQAAASANEAQRAAESTQVALKDPAIVRTDTYVPGKGVTLHAGSVDLNFSGFVNGFYTYNSPGSGTPVAGGLSSGGSGFDSSSVRNGLLPGALIIKASTVEDGIDLAAVFGMYPGLNNTGVGTLNANNGGAPIALGSPGIDFRQLYVTAGTKAFGTVKIGRDIGLFGSDAILNDATLLSVGSPGSNSAPGNTSLGRIGIGYVYTDWLPQITYTSPVIGGFTAAVGLMTPLDEFNFAGGGVSATSTQHSVPMFQGKLTYDLGTQVHLWGDFLVQPQQDLTVDGFPIDNNKSVTVVAGDAGAKLAFGPFGAVAYYYRGSGLGTTALFFDGVAANGNKRDSDGYYVQGSFKLTPKFKLVGSYGVSNLYLADGEVDPTLVRRNESEIGAAYYSLTDWMTLVGEFAHTTSHAHGPDTSDDNTISLGTIVFF
jgi:hypothetical protein